MSYFSASIVSKGATIQEIIRDIQDVPAKVIRPSVNKALNETAKAVHGQAVRDLSQEMNLPKQVISKRLKIKKSKVSTMQARVIALTAPIRAGDAGKFRQTARGARAARRIFPNSFVATMPSGKTSVFERRGRARLPIKYTTIDFHAAATSKIDKLVQGSFAPMVFSSVLETEMRRRMRSTL
jgi:hypothetical protein